MSMTPDAKRALSATIRALRTRLLDDLHAATESAYRLAVRGRDSGLDEAARTRRARLEAWIGEQRRAQEASRGSRERTDADFRREAEKQAAYTLLNRLVILRLMEAPGPNGRPLRPLPLITGGSESRAYKDFRQLAPALVHDETEGYRFLLQLVFEELATELPGLYGPAGVADLIPIPAPTLRHAIDELDRPELATCWTDDMTLGWVYQYWNDPEREEIDARLHAGRKLEPHEIASKTQMFTERYMVDWLLQNSLGPMWLAMCRKHGWTPEAEANADGPSLLQRLEDRRVDWRAKRDSGEVSLTELMPLHTDGERRWAYYVPQPIPDEAVKHAPETVRDIRIMDPAVGSGHFLVVAMDLLVALYREEARHRGEQGRPEWSDRAIVERILSHNLHGIDLDPRAVQIAAAALWLKARQFAPDARPERINLVASNLRLSSLADDDPALVELRLEVERETGIPGTLTDTIVHALRGADHLGSLLKVDRAVDRAISAHEEAVAPQFVPAQGDIFDGHAAQQAQIAFEAAAARQSLLDRLETFLARHTGGDDLGLRLRGEQLAAGVRFVRMVREGTYDLVVANPPYQGTSKMADAEYVESQYPLGKADLYAAFLLRGLQLAREGGVSAMLTMRSWMFISQHAGLRRHLLERHRLQVVGDLDWGAFKEMKDVRVVLSGFQVLPPRSDKSVAITPTGTKPSGRTLEDFYAKGAGLLVGVERYEFDPMALRVVPEWPLVYWWSTRFLVRYAQMPKLEDVGPLRQGIGTRDNTRFIRKHWEVGRGQLFVSREFGVRWDSARPWVPAVMGAAGAGWQEPLEEVIDWHCEGAAIAHFSRSRYGRGADLYFRRGLALTSIGNSFGARLHRFAGIITDAGVSSFPPFPEITLCQLNRREARTCVEELNPTVNFKIADVSKAPLANVQDADSIADSLDGAFGEHESHREPSVEFRQPGPSSWRRVQEWAQAAVDRPDGARLPAYDPQPDPEPPTDHLSFALGVALGRFGANGEGILDPERHNLSHALPASILFLDRTLDADDNRDGLGHSAAAPLHEAWTQYGAAIGTSRRSLREWLALDFFKDVHRNMYENRPIHWPLSSSDKTFVAWVNIHRFTGQTLRILLADHLYPTLNRIDGELNDLRAARDGADRKLARAAEKRYDRVVEARDELQAFIAAVEQCADRGAPQTDAKCPPREQDARYAPDLDDGVMINSAALWPLLEPQWKAPKKWWKELAEARGRKDYDWSHLAMRYWPARVDEKCREDPSLGVAHGCFWRYHPERAWAWELRLQDEIGPEFRIDEAPYTPGGRDVGDAGSGPHRDAWLRDHAQEALSAVEREALRRWKKGAKQGHKVLGEMRILETGPWSAIPGDVWDMELRLSERQGAEFRLVAPDEPGARAAYEAAHPDRALSRVALLASLVPAADSFDLDADADDGDEDLPNPDTSEDNQADVESDEL